MTWLQSPPLYGPLDPEFGYPEVPPPASTLPQDNALSPARFFAFLDNVGLILDHSGPVDASILALIEAVPTQLERDILQGELYRSQSYTAVGRLFDVISPAFPVGWEANWTAVSQYV